MPPLKRTFVISLCQVYRLGHELVDQEPNRSVMIRRKIDTRIPSPLLSSVTPSNPAKNLGGLANLRQQPVTSIATPKPAWGVPKVNGSMAEVLASTSNPVSRTASPNRAPTPVAPLASASGAIAASTTLNGNGSGNGKGKGVKRMEKVVGQVGKVDDGDWDVSEEE